MNVALWVVQGLLAVAFLMAGAMKAFQPKEKLSEGMGWVDDFSENQVKNIGYLEIAAAIGLILPPLLDIAPILSPLAALGLAITMVGAGGGSLPSERGRYRRWSMNLGLLALSLFVVWGRFGPEAF